MRQVSPEAIVPASVNRYLLPHERSYITVRIHPAVLARPLILFSGLVSGGLVAARKLSNRPVRPEMVGGAYLPVLLYFLYRLAARQVTYFTVTDNRMILVSGLVVRKVAMMPLAKVTDMSFQRSAMGRVFGYGEFIVESADQGQALRSVNFLPYPEQLYLEVCGLLFPDATTETQQDQDQSPDSHG
jgi:uncharacterized membrane protein YdbT with pleckstrin-like domain